MNIPANVKWNLNRITVAGGNRQGNKVNQLSGPSGLYVDDNETIYLADFNNNRIMEWKRGAKRGTVVAGGNGKGNGAHQLNRPYDVVVEKNSNSLIISDNGNLRVVRWSRRNGTTHGETLISNISCAGLAMDEHGFLYVVDEGKHEVRRYRIGDTEGTLVAGGNGQGNRLDQLCQPWYVFLDRDHSVYVSDWGNHRVIKWADGEKQGIIVAGGHGKGNSLKHLSSPEGVVVDKLGTVYVSDSWNDRIMRWPKGATQGDVIIGRNRLSCPIGLSFDHHGNLYVVDWGNHRAQRFSPK
ncbi:unnamed protein product [Rotaria socialis]|uniref:Uncharacterized protein n=1 Tax=Rotaria socialis TaxID=392032 RepID=A0A821E9R2_9BILA|nr:unnamed protein product [Rotaria socialis]CAF4631788.1 unnamed protein product [Rotaria socialis]